MWRADMRSGRSGGFTLLELLVVIAIVSLLAAMATQGLLAGRVAANETAAAGTLKTLSAALELYRNANGSYPTAMSQLTAAGGAAPGYVVDEIDSATTGRPRNGYRFLYFPWQQTAGRPVDAFFVIAGPSRRGITGRRLFYLDESGVVRVTDGNFTGRPAAESWPPVSGG